MEAYCLSPRLTLGRTQAQREKVPSSFSSQVTCIPPLLGDICPPCSWASPKEDTPPLWIAVCFGRSALSDIKRSFFCKLALVLSLEDMENQSPPLFLKPALSKEKSQTTSYKTNLNPSVFLNPLVPWHTSLNFNFSLFVCLKSSRIVSGLTQLLDTIIRFHQRLLQLLFQVLHISSNSDVCLN